MIVTSVSYSELVSGENFSNRTIGLTADLGPDESPSDALDDLRKWVRNEHANLDQQRRSERQERQQRDGLIVAREDLRREVLEMQDRYDRAKEFLLACGIPVPTQWDRDVPF